MADPAVLNDPAWPLPAHPEVALALLARWREPHRRYHDVRHLQECLAAGELLGAEPDELLALWFHDAVHTNTPGQDEAASAALAQHLLAPLLPPDRVLEVARLVLLTEHHRPDADDRAGAIVSDADLWVLGADAARYAESVADVRAETGLSSEEWRSARRPQLEARLGQPIFHTDQGRLREPLARGNVARELAQLTEPSRA